MSHSGSDSEAAGFVQVQEAEISTGKSATPVVAKNTRPASAPDALEPSKDTRNQQLKAAMKEDAEMGKRIKARDLQVARQISPLPRPGSTDKPKLHQKGKDSQFTTPGK